MTTVKIRSYNAVRAKIYDKPYTLVDKMILQRSYPHTHTELQFSENHGHISFSSTVEDDVKGCRFKQIDYTKHSERWDTVCIPVTETQEAVMFRKAQELCSLHVGYDFVGLMSFATPLSIIVPNRNKMWCSEASLTVFGCGVPLPDLLVPDHTHPAMCDMVMRHLYGEK